MTREEANTFLFTLEAYVDESADRGEIEHDIDLVIGVIDTERERCAKIADEFANLPKERGDLYRDGQIDAGTEIAEKIRSGEENWRYQ